jgi:hypothetical protein
VEHWRERVASVLTIEDLRGLVAEAVKQQIPAVSEVRQEAPSTLHVVWAGSPGTSSKIVLNNLWAGFGDAPPGERLDRVERFLDTLRLPFDVRLEDRTVERLIPLIRRASYVEKVPELRSISRLLAGDVWVTYAFAFPSATASAQPLDLERLGLSLEEFQASALANLRHRLRPQASPITLAKYRVEAVQADRNNESGVLLLDDYWEAVKKKCQGDILAIVPARDILLYADGAEPWAIQALQLM